MTGNGRLVLLRHGQSTWNDQHRFTGWADPPLSPTGLAEAAAAGRALAGMAIRPDLVVTSVLTRATQTVNRLLQAQPDLNVTVVTAWRLNERHYGALEGLTHAQGEARYGAGAVARWRRSWDACPPPLPAGDPRRPARDARYAATPPEQLPNAESLELCLLRSWPAIVERALPTVQNDGTVLLVGHGNQLRALVRVLEQLEPDQVRGLVLPTGVPRPYQLHDGRWHRQPSPALTGTLSGP